MKHKLSFLKTIPTKVWQRFRTLRKIYQIAIIIALIAAFIGYKFFMMGGYMPDLKVVEAHKVSKGNIVHTTRLLGHLEAKKLFTAKAGYEGTISYIAKAGTELKTGDIIAKIQNEPIEDAYNTALNAADIAEEQYRRQLKLMETKAASPKDVEGKFIALSAAKNALAAAKMNYDRIIFVAPFDGMVGSNLLQVGSRALNGDVVVTFYDNSEFVVKFDIPSNYVKDLGTEASATVNGADHKIDFIQKALSGGTYTVPAHVNFACKDCISGEMLDVDLHIKSAHDVIVVPASCVFIKGQGHFVYTIKDSIVHLASVELGIKEKDQVEVTEGLEVGDEIVLKGQSRLFPEMPVKVWDGKE